MEGRRWAEQLHAFPIDWASYQPKEHFAWREPSKIDLAAFRKPRWRLLFRTVAQELVLRDKRRLSKMEGSNMEVGMNQARATKIQSAAAEALVEWKHRFGSLVRAGAMELATADGCEEITLEHYQQAATTALLKIGNLIKFESDHNERRPAA